MFNYVSGFGLCNTLQLCITEPNSMLIKVQFNKLKFIILTGRQAIDHSQRYNHGSNSTK